MDTVDWYHRSQYVDIQEVRDNPTLFWSKLGLSHNRGLTISDIQTLELPNARHDWDWNIISEHINIQEVRDNPHLPWDREYLSYNRGITLYDIDTLDMPNATGEWSNMIRILLQICKSNNLHLH
jgi:hypothetical protein